MMTSGNPALRKGSKAQQILGVELAPFMETAIKSIPEVIFFLSFLYFFL